MIPRAHLGGPMGLALVALVLALPACDRAPGDARDWLASDHDQPPEADQSPPPDRNAPAGRAQAPGANPDLVEVAWQRNCQECHGSAGRGDGPKGMGIRAPDLTRAAWQAQVSDQQIAETLRTGKNKMPAFKLPAPIVDGLIRRIRASRSAP